MASLEISLNCLCMFVPDEPEKTVHVLMPPTHAGHKHVVRLFYTRFTKDKKGQPMEGWALRIGRGAADAETTLKPRISGGRGAELVDLNAITKKPVPRSLIARPATAAGGQADGQAGGPGAPAGENEGGDHGVHPDHGEAATGHGAAGGGAGANYGGISARLELRRGYVHKMSSQAAWDIDGAPVPMAYRIDWVIPDIADDDFEWIRLGNHDEPEPFTSLADLEDVTGHRRLGVYHVTESVLPPKEEAGELTPAEVQHHFRAYYDVYGFTPQAKHLPSNPRVLTDARTVVGDLSRAARVKLDQAAIDQLAVMTEAMVEEFHTRGAAPDLEAVLQRGKNYDCLTGRGSFD